MAYTGPEKIVSRSDCKKIFHKDYKSNVEKTNALMMLVNEMIRQHVSVKSLEIDEAYLKFVRLFFAPSARLTRMLSPGTQSKKRLCFLLAPLRT